MPTVLAVDVFDKFNFTGAWVPRFQDVRDDFPKELASSLFFSADFFKPPERRGEAPGNRADPGGPAARGRGALRGEEALSLSHSQQRRPAGTWRGPPCSPGTGQGVCCCRTRVAPLRHIPQLLRCLPGDLLAPSQPPPHSQ